MTEDNNSLGGFLKNIFTHKPNEDVRETIEELIEVANSQGQEFSPHEQLLLNNILCLRDKKCIDAMTPRANITGFQKDGTIEALAKLMVAQGHSRIPIYGKSLDDVIGIVHVLDLVKSLIKGQKNTKVADIVIQEAKFVSPSMRVLDLLHNMQINKTHMAMVVDEYGGVDGVITIEDLLEEIVGDIEDEYDLDSGPSLSIQEDGSILADARVELSDLKEVSEIDFCTYLKDEEQEIDTIGGLVFHLAQRIPHRGEIIEGSNGIKFRILEVDSRRIKKLMIIKPDTTKEKDITAVESK